MVLLKLWVARETKAMICGIGEWQGVLAVVGLSPHYTDWKTEAQRGSNLTQVLTIAAEAGSQGLRGCLLPRVSWAPSKAAGEGHLGPKPLHPTFLRALHACPERSF